MGLYVLKFPYRKVLLPLAKRLVFVDPDILSYAATVLSIGTGLCYYFALKAPFLLLIAIVLTFARMTLNTIDGVIAIEQGKNSLKGEIVNALPDRYSDIFHLVGLALSPLCGTSYGIWGLSSVFLVSYSGMLGKALGVEWQHQGPLGKVERLILLMIFSLLQYIILLRHANSITILGHSLTPLEWCMVVFVILGQITVYNRLRGMITQINKIEWARRGQCEIPRGKTLVVYDSSTGNTEKIAREIGQCMGADIRRVDEVQSVKGYDMVVIGTPNIRKCPTRKIRKFLTVHANAIEDYSVFVTWGMPLWGILSTRICIRYFAKTLKRKPLLVFSCKGYHVKYKTHKGHPSERDLLNAYNFGIRLARKMSVRHE